MVRPHVETYTGIIVTIVMCFLLLITGPAFSAEYYGFHRGTRTLGMGGAFTAVADDYNAIYFNPAGLALMKNFTLGILDPMVDVSEKTIDLYQDFDDIDSDDLTQVTALMRKYIGENNHVKAALDLHLGFNVKNAGVMLSGIGQSTFNIRIRNPTNPEANITSVADYGLVLGMGVSIPEVKGLKVGATIKSLSRTSLNEVYSATVIADDDLADMIDDDIEDGLGFSADIGAIYTFNILRATDVNIALAGLNVPKMKFGDAMDAETQINAGVAFRQRFLGCTLTEALDIYDITDNAGDDDSDEKKIHIGAEVQFPMIMSVRGGLNQGYYTAGLTLDFKVLKFDFATYGEEIGVIAGQKEDRRFSAQISMGWLW